VYERSAHAALEIAQAIQAAAVPITERRSPTPVSDATALFDAIVTEPELREEVRQLFLDGHYPQAVEEGFKFLNNLVKRRTGSTADGAALMNTAFSPKSPLLKLSPLTTASQESQQLGYMQILAGSMTGIRNPRAHEHKHLDNPRSALELLALCNHLVRVVRTAIRPRRRKTGPPVS
jgi:uncharacterized protein (TIGR02391 family)